jgi:MFS family permease
MKTAEQQTITREQKEAVGLLSIGTFLEYFDLMLYVHMAVLLNELFFPKTDPFTASLLSAFAFCSVFVLRPFGALIFGYIGDKIGRKATVVITTFLMSISCIIMATLPTYEQIGITAAWLVTICRMLQGLSSMGEIVGAEIYLTEFIKPPKQYPMVMLIAIASMLGGTAALGMAFVATKFEVNWRIAFWVGAGIAVVGGVARTALKETTDFADAKRRLKAILAKTNVENINNLNDPILNTKVSIRTAMAFFFIQCGWPTCFYFTYVYCANILKNSFAFTAEQVIQQNFIVSITGLLGYMALLYLSYKIHPLKILKFKVIVFIPFILFCPYIIFNLVDSTGLLLVQAFLVLFVLSTNPATPIFYSYFPIFKRFSYAGFTYAFSRVFMHIATSFGLIYSEKYFGYWGMLLIMLPVAIGYGFGIFYFVKLEKEAGNYP